MKPITEKSGLDIAMEKVSMWLDRGYIKAWFSWLEWVGLTGLLYVGAEKLNSFALKLLSFGCTVLLFWVGLVYIERLTFSIAPTLRGSPGRVLLIALSLNVVLFSLFLFVFVDLIKSLKL